MVKHYQKILQAATALHAPNEINTTSSKIHKHLQNEKNLSLDCL